MRIELKHIHSPDVDVDEWQPESNSVWFLLELDIGPVGKEGADIFQVMVGTPEGLRKLATADARGVLSNRAAIILHEFSWTALRGAIAAILRECDSSDWKESVLRLQRFFEWEYEDYVQESDAN
jgi:hypothetical protein